MEVHNNYKLIPILRYFTLLLLFLAFSANADAAENVLVPNYDHVEHKLKFFDDRIKKPLLLSCNITIKGDYKLSWKKDDKDVSTIPQLTGRYQIIDKENKFIISKPDVNDAGVYTCSIPDPEQSSAEIHVVANVYFKKVPDNISVVEGEKLQIHCKTFGTDPTITWKIGDNETLNRSRILLREDEDHVKDAILVIEHAELSDRNSYNCSATNLATIYGNGTYPPAEEGAYVRVKEKLAALWPFLGICAEVFILCAIILVYEKRRNKEGLDESDTDQSPEQEKLKTGK